MPIFRESREGATPARWSLDQPLLQLTQRDHWLLRDAFEGVHVFGAIGSGKTSGSGQALAKTLLASGFGGLVLTVKQDEADLWRKYAEETKTDSRIVVFSPETDSRFNFLSYEYCRPDGAQTENLVDLFYTLMEAVEGESNRSSDSYWERSLRQLLRNAIDLLAAADDDLSLTRLKDLVNSAPQSFEDRTDPKWFGKSLLAQLISRADERVTAGELSAVRVQDFRESCRFWLKEFPALSEKTRSVIVSSFTSLLDSFLRGQMRELFCTTTTITPEVTQEGKVIVLDLPIKKWGELGRCAQLVFKYLWQCAAERRTGASLERPMFLWADEAQFFLTKRDLTFQTTARSSRVCTVYLTQNLSNYHALTRSRDLVSAFLGSLSTKIFHASDDPATNEWAADVIARSWQSRTSIGGSPEQEENKRDKDRMNYSVSQGLEYDIIPQTFTRLRKGGERNNGLVDGIFFQNGRVWSNGRTYLQLVFKQDLRQ
jgi:type IV secretory pathway TraG/TraD family ATPase VirD4